MLYIGENIAKPRCWRNASVLAEIIVETSLHFIIHRLCIWLPWASFRLPKASLLCPLGVLYYFKLKSYFINIFLLIIKYHWFFFLLEEPKTFLVFISGSLVFPNILLLRMFEACNCQPINITWLLFSYGQAALVLSSTFFQVYYATLYHQVTPQTLESLEMLTLNWLQRPAVVPYFTSVLRKTG